MSAVVVYLCYVAVGIALGTCAYFLLRRHLAPSDLAAISNLVIYSAAVFAHFRFTNGVQGWPRLEFGKLWSTLAWAVVFIVVGTIVIRIAEIQSYRFLSGFDDAQSFRKTNADFRATVHEGRIGDTLFFLINGGVIAPIAEEILFRSGLYRILKGRVPLLAAAGISSALFAAVHLSISAFLPLLVLGYLCCWVYEKTADIRGPIFFHAGYNFLIFFFAAR